MIMRMVEEEDRRQGISRTITIADIEEIEEWGLAEEAEEVGLGAVWEWEEEEGIGMDRIHGLRRETEAGRAEDEGMCLDVVYSLLVVLAVTDWFDSLSLSVSLSAKSQC